jgi:hypothetical protein
MSIWVIDADTHQPIPHATVTLVRSADATRAPDGSRLKAPSPARTDSGGFTVLKAMFAAEGDPHSTNLLVGNSSLLVSAAGYTRDHSWVSTPRGSLNIRIDKDKALVPLVTKLHFPAGTKRYKASFHVELHHAVVSG